MHNHGASTDVGVLTAPWLSLLVGHQFYKQCVERFWPIPEGQAMRDPLFSIGYDVSLTGPHNSTFIVPGQAIQ